MVKIVTITITTNQQITETIPNKVIKNGRAIDAAMIPVMTQEIIKKNKAQPLKVLPSFGSSFF